MTISEEERRKWQEGARRATDREYDRLARAYGLDVNDDLRRVFRWIAFNMPVTDVGVLIAAFDNLATSNFRDGYRDGLKSAELTEGEREAHENDLGLDVDDEEDGDSR